MRQTTRPPGRIATTATGPRATGRHRAARIALTTAITALPLTTVLTVGSAAPLAPPLGACTGPDCPATWPEPNNDPITHRDASINVFVGGNYDATGRTAEAEGKIVVLGNLDVNKDGGGLFNMSVVGVGSHVVPPDGSDFVTVGGNVTAEAGNRMVVGGPDAFGNLRYAGSKTGDVIVAPTGQAIQDPNATTQYQDALPQIETVSACVGKAVQTGTVVIDPSQATLTGDGVSTKQVFNVAQNLASPTGGQIGLVFENIPVGATVVVNMLGDDQLINTYTGTGQEGDQATELRPKLMYNFPTATKAEITGSAQFQGSVMTGNPDSTITLSQPGINGRIYLAGNLLQTSSGGGYELHSYPFDGDLPDCSATPGPTPAPATGSPTPAAPSPTSPASTAAATATPASASTTATDPATASPSAGGTTPSAADPSPTGDQAGGDQAGSDGDGSGELPHTGMDGSSLVFGLVGLALIGLGGAVAVVAARGRRRRD
ncbi:choice-of-anchor A family protein [Kitasatospora sp. NPDC089797]|uniref:choice-of-anchor A family protein n=1 Tax=Kitasatospora sp. NPDC089797 TaxID=3155298 RepID=UPI00343CDDCF